MNVTAVALPTQRWPRRPNQQPDHQSKKRDNERSRQPIQDLLHSNDPNSGRPNLMPPVQRFRDPGLTHTKVYDG